MNGGKKSAQAFLTEAYQALGLAEGELLSANSTVSSLSQEQWVNKGEWLSLARRVRAERVFFVKNNPVVVFAQSGNSDLQALRMFNRAWCMSRPQLLFLARDGELAVYSLEDPPVKSVSDWSAKCPLDIVNEVAEVAGKLKIYRREQIESGRLFEDDRFGKLGQRADKALIQDLKVVRDELIKARLPAKYAHALIGRSIFIRYLEDRKILTAKYFRQVAGDRTDWQSLLDNPVASRPLDTDVSNSSFIKILSDRDFTYALFGRLAKDFNGDMFPSDPDEYEIVRNGSYLRDLQNFLLGNVATQQKLFLWAYKFDIVPVELISNIYEEFYQTAKDEDGIKDDKGTHYTPTALVDYVLSSALTLERLEQNPRVLDPACGSGIFLVEAFRRIVRFQTQKRNVKRLSANALRHILRTQIAGIEINEEALRLTAFSLYLALLHYQRPKDIIKQIEAGMYLPSLVYQDRASGKFYFNNLLHADTFTVGACKKNEQLPLPFEAIYDEFASAGFNVIVGNPPWGSPNVKTEAFRWCESRKLPVGDKETSQAFIWKALDFLSDEGCVALLVSTGVFFKHNKPSLEFRKKWLSECELKEVVNFAHVRDIFFEKGIAPFASVMFEKRHDGKAVGEHVVRYWSVKYTARVKKMKAVLLDRSDIKLVRQEDLRNDDRLWKVYWWGNHRDKALIGWIETNPPLNELREKHKKRVVGGRGFEVTKKGQLSPKWLSNYQELSTDDFFRYGATDLTQLKPITAEKFWRMGYRPIYDGERLLVKRGISQRGKEKGQIVARLETESLAFRNSIHGIKLRDAESWEYKVLLGILWSSLARYYYFLTSSTWGLWHHEVHLDEIKRLPARFPQPGQLRERIVGVVDQLRSLAPVPPLFGRGSNEARIKDLEIALDDAIFELYELDESERDQVLDLCMTGIEFFYNKDSSLATKPINWEEVSRGSMLFPGFGDADQGKDALQNYAEVFLYAWNRIATKSGLKYLWNRVQPSQDWPLIAMIFSVSSDSGRKHPVTKPQFEEQSWRVVLQKLEENLLTSYRAQSIFIDGLVRIVTPTDLIIIKRNEQRLWTKSMAREDAEAMMVQVANLQDKQKLRSATPIFGKSLKSRS